MNISPPDWPTTVCDRHGCTGIADFHLFGVSEFTISAERHVCTNHLRDVSQSASHAPKLAGLLVVPNLPVDLKLLFCSATTRAYVVGLSHSGTDLQLNIHVPERSARILRHQLQGGRVPVSYATSVIASIISGFGGAPRKLLIDAIDDRHFARLEIQNGGELFQVEMTSSDGLQLAVHARVPLFATAAAIGSSLPNVKYDLRD